MALEDGETVVNLRQALEDDKRMVKQGIITEDEFQQEWYCFPGWTQITTSDGLKPIKDIKIGDFVLTHTGRFRPVTNLMNRRGPKKW